jgi:hypothetical protein
MIYAARVFALLVALLAVAHAFQQVSHMTTVWRSFFGTVGKMRCYPGIAPLSTL